MVVVGFRSRNRRESVHSRLLSQGKQEFIPHSNDTCDPCNIKMSSSPPDRELEELLKELEVELKRELLGEGEDPGGFSV